MITPMPPMWVLALYALAATRLTALVTTDEITRPVRERIIAALDETRASHRAIAYLAGGASDNADGCPWCVSVWIAAATAPIIYTCGDKPFVVVPVLALATSQIVGMIHHIGRE